MACAYSMGGRLCPCRRDATRSSVTCKFYRIRHAAHNGRSRTINGVFFLPSAPLFLLFDSIDTNTLKITRMLAFFRLYEFLTSTLDTVKVPDGLASKEQSIMPIVVIKDPSRLNA